MTDQNLLDRAIDDLARRVTAQEPSADLAARVLERIDAPARPLWTWRLLPVAAALTAVAAIGAVWTLARSNGDAARHPQARSTVTAPAERASAPAGVTASAATVGNVAVVRPVVKKPIQERAPEPTAEELAWRARAVQALEQPEALGVNGIQPEALTIPQIDVKPLVPQPLSASPGDGGGVKR